MLRDLIQDGFGEKEDFNCAEKILYGANISYNLNLSPEALKLSTGFGGGMAIESVCGALTAGIMVLSHRYVEGAGHQNNKIKEINQRFFREFIAEMDSIKCTHLKLTHRKEDIGCFDIVLKAAEILDKLMVK
ncbi:C-GCAxxG-C-C family (seleno)protein [Tissierella sp. MB52-C2]|uniref:C-GCAxxG-C-C family (seleno)protein n=1 Tax=Tissierella sp. MB52-C2 TaxID=3070999 RepID=UPI00280AFF66|nr:C-GCAxxG-C-C family (seleno)protein [Tissierella sp. MB52-C2]WMM25063.1 C-GCAxxG-C-C family (seleno)protein [Tissierella sp. MB52-C2]WMM25083.1 C-GCAxxG-C-C family (seleno)protein [Tissierella sp. MB52-C2]